MIQQGSSLDRALNHDDMNAARELEEEIGHRNIYVGYINALLDICGVSTNEVVCDLECLPYDQVPRQLWLLLHATPEQRAHAFMLATRSP